MSQMTYPAVWPAWSRMVRSLPERKPDDKILVWGEIGRSGGQAVSEKDEVAKRLALKHYDIEPGISRIFKLRDEPERENLASTPIKLLEVNVDTPPSGIMPLYFGPIPGSGIPYSSVIVEVTPDEFERIVAQELTLPNGWTIAEELPRGAG